LAPAPELVPELVPALAPDAPVPAPPAGLTAEVFLDRFASELFLVSDGLPEPQPLVMLEHAASDSAQRVRAMSLVMMVQGPPRLRRFGGSACCQTITTTVEIAPGERPQRR